MLETHELLLLGALTAAIGALGGIGGAVLLVPALVLLGMDPLQAAPLGILSVAAGSLAAGPLHLDDGLVHHRLGVTLEVAASSGAILGALLSDAIPGSILTRALGVVAIVAAMAGAGRTGLRNQPQLEFHLEEPGEWPGTLAGAYRLDDEHVVPYQAKRLTLGMTAMVAAGLVSGLAGVGGGFIKTPAMSEIMHVPVKVAAATSTFTVGITSATALLVFAGQGRIPYGPAAAIVAGGLAGGYAGALAQRRIRPELARRVLTIVLVAVGVVLLVKG